MSKEKSPPEPPDLDSDPAKPEPDQTGETWPAGQSARDPDDKGEGEDEYEDDVRDYDPE